MRKRHEPENSNEIPLERRSYMQVILNILNILGLSLYDSKDEHRTKCQRMWRYKFCCIHVLYISVSYAAVIKYYFFNAFYDDRMSKFTNLIKIIITGTAHLITLMETIKTTPVIEQFVRVYGKLHAQWATPQHWTNEFKLYRKLSIYLGLYTIFMLVVDINYMIELRNKLDWLYFFVSYTPSVFVCRFRLMEFMVFLEFIRIELLQLNREIQRLAMVSVQTVGLNLNEDQIYKDLTQCMTNYADIFRLCDLLKEARDVSFLVIFVQAYAKMISDCYWTYWVIYTEYEVNAIFESSLILPTGLIILLVLIVSKNCMRTAKMIPVSLHSIRHRVENLRLSRKIQHFSLQLRYQQIIIDAFGCFVIDCYMASGILGSITTYMIFYIQFMPKFKNL